MADLRRRCSSCKARRVPVIVNGNDTCGGCGAVLPARKAKAVEINIDEKHPTPNIEEFAAALCPDDRIDRSNQPSQEKKTREQMDAENASWERVEVREWQATERAVPSETPGHEPEAVIEYEPTPFEVECRADAVAEQDTAAAIDAMSEAVEQTTETATPAPATERRTGPRPGTQDMLENLPVGTRFALLRWIGEIEDVNTSFCKVHICDVSGTSRKWETTTWSPAAVVKVISEEFWRESTSTKLPASDNLVSVSNNQTPEAKKETEMRMNKSVALKIMQELKVPGISEATNLATCTTKFTTFIKKAEDKADLQVEDANLQSLLDDVVAQVVAKKEFKVVDDDDGKEVVKVKKEKGKGAEKAEKGTKTKAEKNGTAEKKEKGERGRKIGICSTIEECLCSATAKAPVSTKDILEKLKQAFPDREESSMKSSVNTHVSQLVKGKFADKGRQAHKGEGGYWMKKTTKNKK